MNIHELQTEKLDINNKYNVELVCKQLDDVILKIIVYDKNLPADLSNYNVRLKAFKVDQVPLIQNTNIIIKDNVVTIKADKQLTTTQGTVKAELQFINKTTLEKKSTFYLEIEVVASVLAVEGTVSTPTCTLLEELDNKLDEIENIGNVLEEAKVLRDTLENTTIPAGTTLKNDLDTNIETGTQLKTDLIELIPKANKSKSDLDTSKINADLSNTTLTETTNNAETKKQEVVAECKVADEKIKQMNEFGDVTEVVKDVTSLKTEITTARDNETDLNTRLERDKTNILNTIGQVSENKAEGKVRFINNLNKDILGITFPCTSQQLAEAMKDGDVLYGDSYILSDAPTGYGQLFIMRENNNRVEFQYRSCGGDGENTLNQIFIASYRSASTNKFSGWKQVATVDDTGWIELPLSDGISSEKGYTCRYRKVGKIVQLWGIISGVTTETQSNKVIATLPSGFRPSAVNIVLLPRSTNDDNYLKIYVSNNGAIGTKGTNMSSIASSNGFMLTPIMFLID